MLTLSNLKNAQLSNICSPTHPIARAKSFKNLPDQRCTWFFNSQFAGIDYAHIASKHLAQNLHIVPWRTFGGGCSHIVMKSRSSYMVYAANDLQKFASRSPKRVTITLPYSTLEMLVKRSNEEGRSLSNLAAFILEQGINR
jgi:hypothetical protein